MSSEIKPSTFAIKDKLRRAMAVARASNPVDLAALSSAPTVTTTFDGTLSTYFLVNDLVNSGTRYFNLLGGTAYDIGSVSGAVHGWSVAPFIFSGTAQRKAQVLEFHSDAPKLQIRGQGGGWRVEVNGQFISKSGTSPGGGGGEQQVVLDWSGTRATRLYRVHQGGGGWVSRIGVDSLSRVWAPSLDDCVRVALVSDSYVDGTGATFADQAVGDVACALLGFRDIWHFSAGGTGYLTTGSYNTFRDRAAEIIAAAPDIIINAGGTNDTAGASLTAEVLLFHQTLRAGLAKTPIVTLGPWPKATGPSAAITSIEANVLSAVTSFADPICAFVPVAADATGSWTFGTGKIGTTNSSGNSDVYISSDGVHPGDVGHEYLGRRMAVGVGNALLAMTY
jgi:lysophospholipase L1-like esterase